MSHVRSHEMTGSEGAAQTDFAGENGCCDNAGELSSVLAGVGGMGSSYSEHVKRS